MFAAHYWNGDLAKEVMQQIREHRVWYIFEGLLFIGLGIAAFFMPGVTAIVFEVLFASLLLVSGLIRIFNSFRIRQHRWLRLFSGAVYTIAGAAIFIWPIAGLTALLFVVGALLLLEGIFDIGIALTIRPSKSWGWMLTAGIISLILGVMIFAGFPATGILYLAIALGISFILYGGSILSLALKA